MVPWYPVEEVPRMMKSLETGSRTVVTVLEEGSEELPWGVGAPHFKKFCVWTVMLAVPWYGWTQCHRVVHYKVIKMKTFMLCNFTTIKKKSPTNAGSTPQTYCVTVSVAAAGCEPDNPISPVVFLCNSKEQTYTPDQSSSKSLSLYELGQSLEKSQDVGFVWRIKLSV